MSALEPEVIRFGRSGHWIVLQGLHARAFRTEPEAQYFAAQLRTVLDQAAAQFAAEATEPRATRRALPSATCPTCGAAMTSKTLRAQQRDAEAAAVSGEQNPAKGTDS